MSRDGLLSAVPSPDNISFQGLPALQPQVAPTPIAKPVLPPFAENAENQYGRYVPNSLIISHLLVDQTGRALQFAIPPTGIYEVPVVKPLVGEISAYNMADGKKIFHGKTEDGIDMVSCRSYDLRINDMDYTFIPLSPLKGKRLSSETAFVERFNKTKEAKEVVERTEIYSKSGRIKVVNADIAKRADTPRTPDQNTVMGMSAVEVYKKVLREKESVLSDDAKSVMQVAANTPWRGASIFEAQLRPEHLHLLSYGLYPMTFTEDNPHLVGDLATPQRVGNLGAARRCDNTRMMIQERSGERFLRRYPDASLEIGGGFTMLLDTEVINTIYYWIQIVRGDFKVRFHQKIDAFERDPQFAKSSDMATLVEIFSMIVQNIMPLSTQKVAMSDKLAISQFPRNFYQLKRKPPQAEVVTVTENRKREREEPVVMREPLVESTLPVPSRSTSITRTPFLFVRRPVAPVPSAVPEIDEETVILMNQLIDAEALAMNTEATSVYRAFL